MENMELVDNYQGILTTAMVKEEDKLRQLYALKNRDASKKDMLDSLDVTLSSSFDQLQDLLVRIKKYAKYIRIRMNKTIAEKRLAQEIMHLKNNPNDSGERSEDQGSPPKKFKYDVHSKDVFVNPKYFVGENLRYQNESYEWMKLIYENGIFNSILGKDSGQKMDQVIAFLAFLIEMGVKGPFLICAPLSKLPTWIQEFRRLAPKIPVMLYHGPKEERLKMRKECGLLLQVENDCQAYSTIITTYEMAFRDAHVFEKRMWKSIIIDEANRNDHINLSLLRRLQQFPSSNQIFMTETPLEHRLSDVLPLLNYVLPELFNKTMIGQYWGDASKFNENGTPKEVVTHEQERFVLDCLQEVLSVYVMQRVKPNVNLNIPVKRELNLAHLPLMPW